MKEFDLKNHIHFVKEIFRAITIIFGEHRHADKAIEIIMRSNKKWKSDERMFVAETTYDIIRNWRLLNASAKLDDSLSENNLWKLFSTWLVFRGFETPQHPLLQQIDVRKTQSQLEKFSTIRKIKNSFPDWLDDLCYEELKDKWEPLASAMNKKASVFVRTNYIKTNTEELQKSLMDENIRTQLVAEVPGAIKITSPVNIFRSNAFQKGLFEVQDAASQMVAQLLDVKPGMRVIDACAGTGGKTLSIASMMKNKGRIIALDTQQWKLDELKARAARAGVSVIEIKEITGTKIIKRLHDSADRLLLDVPCSGLGVLRRNPDIKWNLQKKNLEELKLLQYSLLSRYSAMLKPGGKMIYATCSILPSEGEKQIQNFLFQKKDEWMLLEEKRFSPVNFDCDGFYISVLQKEK